MHPSPPFLASAPSGKGFPQPHSLRPVHLTLVPSALPLNRRYRTKTPVLSPMICSSSDLTSGGSNELNCHFRVHQNMWSSNPLFMIFHLLAQFHPKCRTHIACFFCTRNTLSPCNHSLSLFSDSWGFGGQIQGGCRSPPSLTHKSQQLHWFIFPASMCV